MIKQAKKLYKVALRRFEALHAVWEGVCPLQKLALIRGSAECFKQIDEGYVDVAAHLDACSACRRIPISCLSQLLGVCLNGAEYE